MSQMRDLIDRLTAISEDRPTKGDGFFLEYSDRIQIETEIHEITESGDIILLADDRALMVIESVSKLMESANIEEEDLDEDDVEEGNKFSGELAKAKAAHKDSFEVDGKTYKVDEAEYHGRKVPLNKPMKGDVKKSKVYVKDPKTGNIKKVNFGDKKMRIKKSIPGRRKNFRARHHCENPGPKTKARYWSCRAW